jgi:hypothetical protein
MMSRECNSTGKNRISYANILVYHCLECPANRSCTLVILVPSTCNSNPAFVPINQGNSRHGMRSEDWKTTHDYLTMAVSILSDGAMTDSTFPLYRSTQPVCQMPERHPWSCHVKTGRPRLRCLEPRLVGPRGFEQPCDERAQSSIQSLLHPLKKM